MSGQDYAFVSTADARRVLNKAQEVAEQMNDASEEEQRKIRERVRDEWGPSVNLVQTFDSVRLTTDLGNNEALRRQFEREEQQHHRDFMAKLSPDVRASLDKEVGIAGNFSFARTFAKLGSFCRAFLTHAAHRVQYYEAKTFRKRLFQHRRRLSRLLLGLLVS